MKLPVVKLTKTENNDLTNKQFLLENNDEKSSSKSNNRNNRTVGNTSIYQKTK